MLYDLNKTGSLISQFISELRDIEIQADRMRFRRNLERIGEMIAYELSKKLTYAETDVRTPLGSASCKRLGKQPVIASILRAGLPIHNGVLNYFDRADNAFVSAYRKHDDAGQFEIELEYVSCPDFSDRVLIVTDPMLASGSSMVATLQALHGIALPSEVHIVTALCARAGVESVHAVFPKANIWTGAIDEELNDHAYIVPGLGDAGDLAFGPKVQA